uniref:Zinc finger protein 346 n=1 Tax=Periophthalmus magnuspinnatus TaxID=409849 RepID=A0A3B4AA04_9GOBI
ALSSKHSDLFSDTQCKVCSAVLISESQKLTHYQSKKHANKVRRYFFIQNENEPTFKKPSTDDNDCNNGETDRHKVCLVCNMTFTSPVMAESHYQGKVHAKNLRLKTVGPQNTGYPCVICKLQLNSVEQYQSHISGAKHKNQ